jgi:hypothetical protein
MRLLTRTLVCGAAALLTPSNGLVKPLPVLSGIVLISIDTLRADAVFPATGPSLMPELAQRARAHGQVFANEYAASTWTLPSHASMLSGRYPSAHGAEQSLPPTPLGGDLLPEKLSAGGMLSFGIVGGGFVSKSFGLDTGFDEFFEPGKDDDDGFVFRKLDELEPRLERQPFFLFVHTYRLHNYFKDAPVLRTGPDGGEEGLVDRLEELRDAPPTPPDEEVATLARDLYAKRARLCDRWLSALLDRFDRPYAGGRPLVVVTSDHGEGFGEGPRGRAWHHAGAPDESQIHVPLIVFHPDREPRPEVTALTSGVDLSPTLLAWSGVARASQSAGIDLRSPRIWERDGVYCENFLERREDWALMRAEGKLVHVRIGPTRQTDWVPGHPGAYDEAAAAPPGQPALDGASDDRRRLLMSSVDGLFIEGMNAGDRTCELTAILKLEDPASASLQPILEKDLNFFSLHLFESNDTAEMTATPGVAAVRLSLPPGDVDLVIVRDAGAIQMTVEPRSVEVAISGGDGSYPYRLGRRLMTTTEPPPRDGCQLRVWENRPSGRMRATHAQGPISEDARERLRALGYIHGS